MQIVTTQAKIRDLVWDCGMRVLHRCSSVREA